MKTLVVTLFLFVLVGQFPMAQNYDNKPCQYFDSLINNISEDNKKIKYNSVNIPDSVLVSRYRLTFSKSEHIKIPDIVSQGNSILPDSVKIYLYIPYAISWGPTVFSIYKDSPGSAGIKSLGLKRELSIQYSKEVLRLINNIFLVNKGQIVVEKRKIKGGICTDRPQVKFRVYYNGKPQNYEYKYIGRLQEYELLTYSQSFMDLWTMLRNEFEALENLQTKKELEEIKEKRRKRIEEYKKIIRSENDKISIDLNK